MRKVILLDDERVKINGDAVVKITTQNEVDNLLRAKELVDGKSIVINGKTYIIRVPKVYKYEDGKVYMQRCCGENLEIILRTKRKHILGVEITNSLIQQFISIKFFWKDFAPRNILVDEGVISIFDFERGIAPSDVNLADYFFENVFEEYTAFLLPNERIFAFNEIFAEENKNVAFNNIESRRIRMLIEKLGLKSEIVPFSALVTALKLIVDKETPYFSGKRNVFPLIYLENYLHKYGYEKYCKRILAGKMRIIRRYNPFNVKEYDIVEYNKEKYFVYNDRLLKLCKEGYMPKSGLLYDFALNKEICDGKTVLDLGCGYLGILGLIAYFKGAKKIDAVDFDINCVKWFNQLIVENNFRGIRCFCSDFFENVKDNYDLILTNPPQMPMVDGSLHDSGGVDGRQYIIEIMQKSLKHLNDGGYLYILVFDFLGTDRRTNDELSIFEIAKQMGYKSVEIVYEIKKQIKENSITFQNFEYIKSIYPKYNFGVINLSHNIQILRMGK